MNTRDKLRGEQVCKLQQWGFVTQQGVGLSAKIAAVLRL